VEEVGPGVTKVKRGDRVVACFDIACVVDCVCVCVRACARLSLNLRLLVPPVRSPCSLGTQTRQPHLSHYLSFIHPCLSPLLPLLQVWHVRVVQARAVLVLRPHQRLAGPGGALRRQDRGCVDWSIQ
jgi:hypothetical protein